MLPPGQTKYGAQHGSCHLIIMMKLHSFVHWSIHLLMFSFIYSAQLMSLPDSSNGCWPNDYMCNTKNLYIQQTLRCSCVTAAMIYNTILCQNLQDYTLMLKNYSLICWTFCILHRVTLSPFLLWPQLGVPNQIQVRDKHGAWAEWYPQGENGCSSATVSTTNPT